MNTSTLQPVTTDMSRYHEPIKLPKEVKESEKAGIFMIAATVLALTFCIIYSELYHNLQNFSKSALTPTDVPGQFSITLPSLGGLAWFAVIASVVYVIPLFLTIYHTQISATLFAGALFLGAIAFSLITSFPPTPYKYLVSDQIVSDMSQVSGIEFTDSKAFSTKKVHLYNDSSLYTFDVTSTRNSNGEKTLFLTVDQ